MRDYVHLHRKALASWVFEDLRRWHLFSFLLLKADEKGRVEVSVKEYASTYNISYDYLRRTMKEMTERGIIATETLSKRTLITLCKYELYQTSATFTRHSDAIETPLTPTSQEEKEEVRERKFPPHPLIKKEVPEKREELSATALRRESENDGQGALFQDFTTDNERTAVSDADSTPKAPSTQPAEVPSFEQFWDAYAYKRDRRSAERVWKRMSAADRRAAYEGIAAYRADCAHCERQMMYAQGYLNRRRWEDDFTTSPHPQGTQQPPFTQPQTPRHNEICTYPDSDRGRYSREEQRTAERNLRAQQAADLIARLAAQNRPVDQDLR